MGRDTFPLQDTSLTPPYHYSKPHTKTSLSSALFLILPIIINVTQKRGLERLLASKIVWYQHYMYAHMRLYVISSFKLYIFKFPPQIFCIFTMCKYHYFFLWFCKDMVILNRKCPQLVVLVQIEDHIYIQIKQDYDE